MKHRIHPVPSALRLDPDSRGPIGLQVFELLQRVILEGILPAGSVLPSTRTLAAHLDVSRNTVLNAYEELAIQGLVTGRTGSGTRVLGGIQIPRMPDPREILRASHYPRRPVPFADPEGNPLHLHG